MTDTTNTTSDLPLGMALIETAAGRWFPAYAPGENPPRFVQVVYGSTDIPPALGPLENPEQGYCTRWEAIGAYLSWHEAAVLPVRWQMLAARTELFPERNAWYLEEIARLTGDDGPLSSCGTEVYMVVMANRHGIDGPIAATGETIDEAIEALYQRVSARYVCEGTLQERAS